MHGDGLESSEWTRPSAWRDDAEASARRRGEVDGVATCQRVFGSLVDGDVAAFLSGCTDDVSLTVHGTQPGGTVLRATEVPAWFHGPVGLDGGRLTTAVDSVTGRADGAVVHLVHSVHREGRSRSWETVNICTVRGGKVAHMTSYPIDLHALADAWMQGPSGTSSER